jgi:hypothetical protein
VPRRDRSTDCDRGRAQCRGDECSARSTLERTLGAKAKFLREFVITGPYFSPTVIAFDCIHFGHFQR